MIESEHKSIVQETLNAKFCEFGMNDEFHILNETLQYKSPVVTFASRKLLEELPGVTYADLELVAFNSFDLENDVVYLKTAGARQPYSLSEDSYTYFGLLLTFTW